LVKLSKNARIILYSSVKLYHKTTPKGYAKMSAFFAKSAKAAPHQACDQLPYLITTGEPAGIGMDIVIDALCHHRDQLPAPLLILADCFAFDERVAMLKAINAHQMPDYAVIDDLPDDIDNIDNQFIKDKLSGTAHSVIILHIPCTDKVVAGQLSAHNAPMVERQLHLAHVLASTKQVAAIITAPLQKSVMIDGGVQLDNGDLFSGHTEYFMHKAGCDKVVMMLANRVMKVALVTTHLPLRAVADAITKDEVQHTVDIVLSDLQGKFGLAQPKILVCGLNPHAGEGGLFGREELEVIAPAIAQARLQGLDVTDPLAPDTVFMRARHTAAKPGEFDVVLAMYHDQGLIPVKYLGVDKGVNVTLGLPLVRTSPDHSFYNNSFEYLWFFR